jgi:uncharacterized membrane protein YhaH (DUF805 family)
MLDAFVNGIKRWKRWDGRTRRRDYWLYTLCHALILTLLYTTATVLSHYEITGLAVFAWIAFVAYCFLSVVPTLAITIRRLHDTGKGAPVVLLGYLATAVEFIVLAGNINLSLGIILVNAVSISCSVYFYAAMLKKGDVGRNKFGADPKDEFTDENAHYGEYPDFKGE